MVVKAPGVPTYQQGPIDTARTHHLTRIRPTACEWPSERLALRDGAISLEPVVPGEAFLDPYLESGAISLGAIDGPYRTDGPHVP